MSKIRVLWTACFLSCWLLSLREEWRLKASAADVTCR